MDYVNVAPRSARRGHDGLMHALVTDGGQVRLVEYATYFYFDHACDVDADPEIPGRRAMTFPRSTINDRGPVDCLECLAALRGR